MRSSLTVTQPATSSLLTTLEAVKAQLGITVTTYDDVLDQLIEQASSRVEAYLRFRVPLETVVETFRPERGECGYAETLYLTRRPVVSASVSVDSASALGDADFSVDPDTGMLIKLDGAGNETGWTFSQSVAVTYSAGYILPDDTDRNLPHAIEGGTIALVRSLYFARQRDPMARSVDIPGLISEQIWVGSTSDNGALPPDVEAMLSDFRRQGMLA